MAAPGIGNVAGAQQVDGFDPFNITAYAMSNISGGAFVFASGANNVVSSGTNSFASSDITVATDASGGQFTGIALMSALSGVPIPVALQGIFILQANGTTTAALPQQCDGNNSVSDAGSVAGNVSHQRIVGRALTSAASGGFALVFVRG